jgi:hypothetical protein
MTQLSRPQPSTPQLVRYCGECGGERPFHAEPASCPDGPDGDCPEWGCTACGEALIIGLAVRGAAAGGSAARAA